jgi:hypothetical protein
VYEACRPEPFGCRGRNELGWNGVGEERSDSELEEGNGKGRESQVNEKKKPAGLMCQDTSDNLASDRTPSQSFRVRFTFFLPLRLPLRRKSFKAKGRAMMRQKCWSASRCVGASRRSVLFRAASSPPHDGTWQSKAPMRGCKRCETPLSVSQRGAGK